MGIDDDLDPYKSVGVAYCPHIPMQFVRLAILLNKNLLQG